MKCSQIGCRTEIGQIKEEMLNVRGKEGASFRREFRSKIALIGPMSYADKQLKALRKQKRLAEARNQTKATKARIERLDAQMDKVVDQFNKRYQKAQ